MTITIHKMSFITTVKIALRTPRGKGTVSFLVIWKILNENRSKVEGNDSVTVSFIRIVV